MSKKAKKLTRILIGNFLSLLVYWYLENSERFKHVQSSLDKDDVKMAFEFFLIYNGVKYFFLLFFVVSSCFFILLVVKDEE